MLIGNVLRAPFPLQHDVQLAVASRSLALRRSRCTVRPAVSGGCWYIAAPGRNRSGLLSLVPLSTALTDTSSWPCRPHPGSWCYQLRLPAWRRLVEDVRGVGVRSGVLIAKHAPADIDAARDLHRHYAPIQVLHLEVSGSRYYWLRVPPVGGLPPAACRTGGRHATRARRTANDSCAADHAAATTPASTAAGCGRVVDWPSVAGGVVDWPPDAGGVTDCPPVAGWPPDAGGVTDWPPVAGWPPVSAGVPPPPVTPPEPGAPAVDVEPAPLESQP